MKLYLIASAIVGAALAGCSSSATTHTAPTTTPSTSTASTSSAASSAPTSSAPALWSKSYAASQYLAMVAPSSKDAAAYKALAANAPISQYSAAATKISSDEYKLVAELTAGAWPAAAQPAISTLISAVASEAALFKGLAADSDYTTLNNDLTAGESVILAVNGDSSAARVALGLSATTS